MRGVAYRGVAVLVVSFVLAGGTFAVSREGAAERPRTRDQAVVKAVKKIIRSLGDLLVTPTP